MNNLIAPYCKAFHLKTLSPEQLHLTNHIHNDFELLFFLDGKAEIVINSNTYKMKKGDVFIIKPAVFHVVNILDFSVTYERVVINFSEPFIPKESLTFFNDCSDLYKFNEDNIVYALFNEFIKNHDEYRENKELINGFIKTLLFTFSKQKEYKNILPVKTNETLEKILSFIYKSPFYKITAELISKTFFVSPSWIAHSFKKFLGISFMQYVNKKRLVYAESLIRKGVPPTDASIRCNFADYSTFYRQYKKYFGTSPKNSK